MDSKVSIAIATGSCIKVNIHVRAVEQSYPFGITLKRKSLERWMQSNGYNYYKVAREMKMHPFRFMRKLCKGKPFSEGQIRRLTFLLGAREMFFVIHFPTKEERRRVFRETFGSELPVRKKRNRRQRIIWAKE